MTESITPEPTEAEIDAAFAGIADLLTFSPVPFANARFDGWTRRRQMKFIGALAMMGVVASAARAVGMTVQSAYRLRKRPGAESFAEAWDDALRRGRDRAYGVAVDRAMNGYRTPVRYRGRIVGERHQYDNRMIMHALREPPTPPRGNQAQRRPSQDEMAWAQETYTNFIEMSRLQEEIEDLKRQLHRARGGPEVDAG